MTSESTVAPATLGPAARADAGYPALDRDRATAGSLVLNMSGQVGSAVGVSLLVALTATTDPLHGYAHAWVGQAGLGLAAAAFPLTLSQRRTPTGPSRNPERTNHGS